MFVQRNATKRPPQTYDMIEHTSVSLCGSSSFPVGLTLFLEEGYKLRLMIELAINGIELTVAVTSRKAYSFLSAGAKSPD